MKKLLIITSLFYLLIAMACGTSKPAPRPAPRPSKPPLTQKPAPSKTPIEERPQLPIQDNYKDIQWVDSERLMPVLEDAQRLKKNVFVVFYATWCAPCEDLSGLSAPSIWCWFVCVSLFLASILFPSSTVFPPQSTRLPRSSQISPILCRL